MIGMQDENPVHHFFDDRIDFIRLGRIAERHAQEIAGVGQVVLRIEERTTDAILIGHRRNRRHFGDQAVRRDHPLLRIGDVGRVMIKG